MLFDLLVIWCIFCGYILLFILFLLWYSHVSDEKKFRQFVMKQDRLLEITGKHSIFEIDQFGQISLSERTNCDH